MSKLLISMLLFLGFNANAQYVSFRSFKLDFGSMFASDGVEVLGSGL